jgi:hypothetical protein
MNQLLSEITHLGFNPTKNQAELDSKRKKLKELEEREKELKRLLGEQNKSDASETKNKGDRTEVYVRLGTIASFLLG